MPCTTQPQAKKKISRSTQKGGAQQDLVVHPRAPAHHQAHAVVLAPSATLGSMPELIDAERWKPSEWFMVLPIIVCVVGLNVMRMVLMAMGGSTYETVHSPSGGAFFNLLILAVSMLLSLIGVRREIWADCSRSHSRLTSSWQC